MDGGHSRALLPAPLLVNLVPLLSELMLPDYVRRLGLAQEVVTVSVLKGIESPGQPLWETSETEKPLLPAVTSAAALILMGITTGLPHLEGTPSPPRWPSEK